MTAKPKRQPANKKKKVNWIGIISILFLVVFILVYVFSNMPMWGEKPVPKKAAANAEKPVFDIEGTLQFLNESNKPFANFYVEVADDPYSREKGMMYKYYIPDTIGMLFIFPKADHRFFWMKNTPSSLDIIYADQDFNIVSIHENTPPYSMKSIPSGDKAKYVIELKAGSVARFGINKNHSFTWQPTN